MDFWGGKPKYSLYLMC